jgi:hypothetical protein
VPAMPRREGWTALDGPSSLTSYEDVQLAAHVWRCSRYSRIVHPAITAACEYPAKPRPGGIQAAGFRSLLKNVFRGSQACMSVSRAS